MVCLPVTVRLPHWLHLTCYGCVGGRGLQTVGLLCAMAALRSWLPGSAWYRLIRNALPHNSINVPSFAPKRI